MKSTMRYLLFESPSSAEVQSPIFLRNPHRIATSLPVFSITTITVDPSYTDHHGTAYCIAFVIVFFADHCPFYVIIVFETHVIAELTLYADHIV